MAAGDRAAWARDAYARVFPTPPEDAPPLAHRINKLRRNVWWHLVDHSDDTGTLATTATAISAAMREAAQSGRGPTIASVRKALTELNAAGLVREVSGQRHRYQLVMVPGGQADPGK